MSKQDGDKNWLANLGVTIHEVLRYCYGGLLAFLVAALIAPAATGKMIELLTMTVSVFIALALGGAIYALQREFSELLHPFGEWIHCWLSTLYRFRNKSRLEGKGYICCSDYFLEEWNIPRRLSREAYRTLRDSKTYNRERRKRFYQQHSEIFTTYVSSFVLLIGAIVVWACRPEDSLVPGLTLIIFAIITFVLGTLGDARVCRQECIAILLLEEKDIREVLEKAQFIKPDANTVKTSGQNNLEDSPPVLHFLKKCPVPPFCELIIY